MANSRTPGLLGSARAIGPIASRTPGPMGLNDHADPNITSLLGDTPGPLGRFDSADVSLCTLRDAARSPAVHTPWVVRVDGVNMARAVSELASKASDVLTFPGTKFRYRPTTLPLDDCLATLPSDLRSDFKKNIEFVITKMHELGFSLGVESKHKAGYRTFQEQYEIPVGATRAGPGESFHNYLCAVDLGFLQWIDETGKVHANDYWLGQMDANPKYKGLSSLLWARRNGFSDDVYGLSFEIIHLQSVPEDTSGRTALLKCLNQAAKEANSSNWAYRRNGKTYQSTLGAPGERSWTSIGSAKQMWDQSGANCTSDQRKIIRKHMELAEAIAKTIEVT